MTLRLVVTAMTMAAAALLIAFGSAITASGTELPLEGGPGGGYFKQVCKPGSYLVGFHGSTGAWVDAIAIICAPYLANEHRFGQHQLWPNQGGSGGAPESVYCPSKGEGVSGISTYFTQLGGRALGYVDWVQLHCLQMDGGSADVCFDSGDNCGFGHDNINELESITPMTCPSDEVATGIQGRSGDFVDAIGLICGPLPDDGVVAAPPPRYQPRSDRDASGSYRQVPPVWQPRSKNPAGGYVEPGSTGATPPPMSSPDPAPADFPDAGPSHGVKVARGIRYDYPHIRDQNGQFGLLDWCREWGSNCGTPAAEEFCRTVHHGKYPNVSSSAELVGAGRFRETVIISTGAACTDKTCGGFQYIVCSK